MAQVMSLMPEAQQAFSSPVTPSSEAQPAADAVFGTWPSFRKKRKVRCLAAAGPCMQSIPHWQPTCCPSGLSLFHHSQRRSRPQTQVPARGHPAGKAAGARLGDTGCWVFSRCLNGVTERREGVMLLACMLWWSTPRSHHLQAFPTKRPEVQITLTSALSCRGLREEWRVTPPLVTPLETRTVMH